jgi:hypothetical protein
VRRTAAPTALSLGANVEEEKVRTAQIRGGIGNQIAGIAADRYGQLQEKARRDADEAALNEAQLQLGTFTNEFTTDALKRTGSQAVGVADDAEVAFEKRAGEIAASLSTDAQRAAFARLKTQQQLSLGLSMNRHEASEFQAQDAKTTKALVEMKMQAAVFHALDPDVIEENLTSAVGAQVAYLKRIGASAKEIDAAVAGVRSGVHVGVIRRLVDSRHPGKAQSYFAAVADEIQGDKVGEMETLLKIGIDDGRARRIAEFVAVSGGTNAQQRARVKETIGDKGEDEEVLAKALQLLDYEHARKKSEIVEADRTFLDTIYADLAKTQGRRPITPTDMERLGTSVRAVQDYAESLRVGKVVKTDDRTFFRLMDLHDAEVYGKGETGSFSNYVFTPKDWNSLSSGDLQELRRRQTAVKAGKWKADQEAKETFDDPVLTKQLFNDAWVSFNGSGRMPTAAELDDDPVLSDRIIRMRRLVSDAVERLPKTAKSSDVQAVVDRIFSVQAKSPGIDEGWFYFDAPTTKRLDQLTIADVPADKKATALRVLGSAATDAMVLTWYSRYLASGGK